MDYIISKNIISKNILSDYRIVRMTQNNVYFIKMK